jgi:hypothetical protein
MAPNFHLPVHLEAAAAGKVVEAVVAVLALIWEVEEEVGQAEEEEVECLLLECSVGTLGTVVALAKVQFGFSQVVLA